MNRTKNVRWIADLTAVTVAGLVLGLIISRGWWSLASLPLQEPAATRALRPVQGQAEQYPVAEPKPASAVKSLGKRALLVGVTRYDHLAHDLHLAGPANDVRLMRRLLQERYGFPAEGIVSLSEDEG